MEDTLTFVSVLIATATADTAAVTAEVVAAEAADTTPLRESTTESIGATAASSGSGAAFGAGSSMLGAIASAMPAAVSFVVVRTPLGLLAGATSFLIGVGAATEGASTAEGATVLGWAGQIGRAHV